MNIRRALAATAAAVAVFGALSVGLSAPASAEPELIIPTCAHMFDHYPSQWNDFAAENGQPAVAYRPVPRLYGSDNPTLKRFLRAWDATTCSWHLAKAGTSRNFTISEVHMNSYSDRILRAYFRSHGVAGVDEDVTLSGIVYRPTPYELDVLMHGRVWISITERGTQVEGYTMQAATATIDDLDTWILSGSE